MASEVTVAQAATAADRLDDVIARSTDALVTLDLEYARVRLTLAATGEYDDPQAYVAAAREDLATAISNADAAPIRHDLREIAQLVIGAEGGDGR